MSDGLSKHLDVLHITQPTTEGVGKVVSGFVKNQIASGLRVAVASPDTPEFCEPLVQLGCQWFPWNAVRSPLKGVALELRSLSNILRQTNPIAVHAHSAKAGMITRLCVRGRRNTVFHPNGWSFHVGSAWVRSAAFQFEITAANQWTHSIICASCGERDALKGRVDASKIHLIHNGLNLKKWQQADLNSKSEARSLLGIDQDATLVVAVGRASRQKGPDLMLEMWPVIRSRCPQAQLIWIGDGDLLNLLVTRTAADPSVSFPGATNQYRAFIDAADVIVMPSRWEGHSLSLLESLASGRPVVAFEVEGMRDTITTDVGTVVPIGDLTAFSNAVVAFLKMPPDQLKLIGERAVSRIREHFDSNSMFRRVIELYNLDAPGIRTSPNSVD